MENPAFRESGRARRSSGALPGGGAPPTAAARGKRPPMLGTRMRRRSASNRRSAIGMKMSAFAGVVAEIRPRHRHGFRGQRADVPRPDRRRTPGRSSRDGRGSPAHPGILRRWCCPLRHRRRRPRARSSAAAPPRRNPRAHSRSRDGSRSVAHARLFPSRGDRADDLGAERAAPIGRAACRRRRPPHGRGSFRRRFTAWTR